MKKIKIFFKLLIIVFILLLIADISVKLICRITSFNHGSYGYGLYVNNKVLGFSHNIFYQKKLKNAKVKTELYGNRNLKSYANNKISVYVIGDSQVDNFVEDKKLFTYFLNNEQEKYYFYNFGVAAYSTLQELLSLKYYNIPQKSNVLLVFYLGNDLKQMLDFPGTVPGLIKNNKNYIIRYPDKSPIPYIINDDPIINLLYMHKYKKKLKNKNIILLTQGKEEYEFFKNDKKQLEEAFKRYEFLIKKYSGSYYLNIIILGNFYLSLKKETKEKLFFEKLLKKISYTNRILDIPTYNIILPMNCWDNTYHLNENGNRFFADFIKKIYN